MSAHQEPVPVFDNTDRRGESTSEAIFGDKQAQFLQDTAPEGRERAEKYLRSDELSEDASHAAALMALHQRATQALTDAAAHGDWPQDRVDDAQQKIDKEFSSK
jgi:hypothetical protein